MAWFEMVRSSRYINYPGSCTTPLFSQKRLLELRIERLRKGPRFGRALRFRDQDVLQAGNVVVRLVLLDPAERFDRALAVFFEPDLREPRRPQDRFEHRAVV